MHVLIIHQAFAKPTEAGGTRHYEFARHLGQQGHQVTVVAGRVNYLTGAPLEQETAANAEPGLLVIRPRSYAVHHKSFIHRAASFVSFMLVSFFAALKIRDVDIVVGTSPPILQGATAWAVARLKRAPFVFEVRDLWPDFAIELGILTNHTVISAARVLERFLYRRADRLLVNSPGFISHIEATARRTPILIPNGADASMFSPEETGGQLRAQWQAADRVVVLYAGAHGTANGLETVLEAATLLRDAPRILFVFVGDGKEKAALEAFARAERLDNVRFEPAQPKSLMPAIIGAADICLATLRNIPLFRTTYPNKVFDYMAAGKPSIVAIDGVIRELVEDSGGGLFVPPGNAKALADAVERLAADRALRLQMGSSGRAFVLRHFNRHDQARSFGAVLDECSNEAGL